MDDVLRIAQALEKIAIAHKTNSYKLRITAKRLGNGWDDMAACEEAVRFTADLCAKTRIDIWPEDVREGYALVRSGEVPIGYVRYLADLERLN